MHELSITQSVVDAVTRRMGDARVRRVRLEVGRLSGLVPGDRNRMAQRYGRDSVVA